MSSQEKQCGEPATIELQVGNVKVALCGGCAEQKRQVLEKALGCPERPQNSEQQRTESGPAPGS